MSYDSNNRRLYVDAANGRGITIQEVDECLRLNGVYDLGFLCTSDKLNEWSKNKPFIVANGVNVRGRQDEAARRLAAYGFAWWNYSLDADAPFGRSAGECLDKAIAKKGEWQYKKPTEVFRLTDFDGYWHLAERPYQYDINSPDLGQNNYCRVLHDVNDPKVEITLSDMPDFMGEFEGSVADLNLVILYRMKNGTTTNVVFTGYTVGDLDAGNTTDPKTLTFPALTSSLREWDVVFAATNAQSADETDDVFYLYLPESLTTIAQKLGITWQYENAYVYGETFYGIVPANSGGEVVTQPNDVVSEVFLGISFLNQFDNAIDWKIQVYAWNENEGDTIADAYTIYTDSGVLQRGARWYFEDAGDTVAASLSDIVNPTLANTLIAINFQYKDTRNSDYVSKHFNLLSGSLDQYEASAGVSLYDLQRYANNAQPINE